MQQYFLKMHSKCNDMKSAFLCQFTTGDFPVFLISPSTYTRFFETTTVLSLTKLSFSTKLKKINDYIDSEDVETGNTK